jgi:hypothetical protein
LFGYCHELLRPRTWTVLRSSYLSRTIWACDAGREQWPRIPGLKTVYVTFLADLTSCLADAIDQDRAAQRVATSMPSRSVAMMTLWSVERAVFATIIGALGFAGSAAIADALVAQYLALVYGLTYSQTT